MAGVPRLETLCFDHILWKLEQYKTEDLSLLPKKYRVETLLLLPLVDVCGLEGTQFTADIAMDTIWEQLYERYIGSTTYVKPKPESWKMSLLSKLAATILESSRPYGYYLRKSFAEPNKNYVVTAGLTDHPSDNINYLVAMKRKEPRPWEVGHPYPWSSDCDPDDIAEMMELFVEMAYHDVVLNCHQATISKGVVPPGKAYEQGCENNQLIPPRNASLLNPGSRFLPNLTALKLIKKCGFCLKSMDISLSTFGAFLLHAQNERVGFLESLRDVLSTVESVTFRDPQQEVPRGLLLQDKIKDSAKELLQQAVQILATSMLRSVSIATTDKPHHVTDCITPVLTTSPSCLHTFKYSHSSFGPLCSQFQLLQQTSLREITIEEVEDEAFSMIFSVSWERICPWLEAALTNQSLELLSIHIRSLRMNSIVNMLGMFLSAPCSEQQTLSLKIRDIELSRKDSAEKPSPAEVLSEKLEKIDESLLEQKSVEFVERMSDFSLKVVKPIRIGQLILTRSPLKQITTLLQNFEPAKLRFNFVEFRTFKDYPNLYKSLSLKSVMFNSCKNIQLSLLRDAVSKNGFKFSVIMESDSTAWYMTTRKNARNH